MPAPSTTHNHGNGGTSVAWVCSIAVGFFIVYGLALPPDITWGDGPELAASAWVLGIPHPTGYPLYMLLLHAFQQIPVGTVAFRSHLFSALCASAALAVLGLLLLKITRSLSGKSTMLPATLSIVALGTTQVFWDQATETEVYALFSLLLALLLYSIYRMVEQQRSGYTLFVVIGLSLAHHRLAIFTIALAGVVWLWLQWKSRRESQPATLPIREAGIQALCLILPLTLFLYFPIRALADPPINWYDPETFQRFYALISGELYSGILATGIQVFWMNLSIAGLIRLISLPLMCYSLFAFAIVYGVITICRSRQWLLIGYSALALVHLAFMRVYIVGDWYVFLLPVLILLTVPLTVGLTTIVDKLGSMPMRSWIRSLTVVALAGCALLPALTPFNEEKGILQRPVWIAPFPLSAQSLVQRFDHNTDASTFATRAWDAIPEDAIVLIGLNEPTSDNELHPLLYQQIVEGRGESNVLISGGFLYLDWYRNQISEITGLSLPTRGDQKYLTREESFDALWNEIVVPVLESGRPLVTPSLGVRAPLYRDWQAKLDTEILVTPRVNPMAVPFSYRPYVPGGTITQLRLEEQASP